MSLAREALPWPEQVESPRDMRGGDWGPFPTFWRHFEGKEEQEASRKMAEYRCCNFRRQVLSMVKS